jgi:hypothetical protein
MNTNQEICLYCERSSEEVPLIAMRHRGRAVWICPQHLPILIHQPSRLADKLPGAANLGAPEGHE